MARSAGSGPGCGRQDVGYRRGSVVVFTHPPYADAPALVCQPLQALEALARPDHRANEG